MRNTIREVYNDCKWRTIYWFEGSEKREILDLVKEVADELNLKFRIVGTERPYGDNYDVLCTNYMYKKFSKRFMEKVREIINEYDWLSDVEKENNIFNIYCRFNVLV